MNTITAQQAAQREAAKMEAVKAVENYKDNRDNAETDGLYAAAKAKTTAYAEACGISYERAASLVMEMYYIVNDPSRL